MHIMAKQVSNLNVLENGRTFQDPKEPDSWFASAAPKLVYQK
jgi:hypothetical protein